jgi:DNA (cytosine-5)-methyltransferase 1
VSLFSGCGGFDLGLQRAGFAPVIGFDTCPDAISHYQRHVCSRAEVADLRDEIADLPRGEVVIAGPPCQGFSTAGKRDVADDRNHLLPLAGRIAARIQPKVVMIENVWAAKAGAHGKYWNELEEHFRGAGYKVHTLRCDAADLGLAQTRRRLLLIAWKGHRSPDFDALAAGFSKCSVRLDEVLSDLDGLHNHDPEFLAPGTRDYRIAQRIGPGQKLSNVRGGPRAIHTWNIPEVFGPTSVEECRLLEFVMRVRRQERRRESGDADPVGTGRIIREFGRQADRLVRSLLAKGYLRRVGNDIDLCHAFNGKYRRFQWEDKACAVDTRFGEAQLFLHPNEHRPFTVREAARIQDFPDHFDFTCSKRTAFRLIGNAVPPRMGELAARCAKEVLGR